MVEFVMLVEVYMGGSAIKNKKKKIYTIPEQQAGRLLANCPLIREKSE